MDNKNGKLLVQAGKSALNIILKQPAKPLYLQGAYCLACARLFHRLPAPEELLIKKEGQHLFPDGPEWIVTQHGTLLALSYYSCWCHRYGTIRAFLFRRIVINFGNGFKIRTMLTRSDNMVIFSAFRIC